MTTPVIVVHGGCALKRPEVLEAATLGVKESARAGNRILATGGTALDAVEAAVIVLEDNPIFNAGFGSALTATETVEMDAAIMDGRDLRTGGVACVTNIRNPVSLAKTVMNKTEHILLVGQGANDLAKEHNIPIVPTEELVSSEARLKFDLVKQMGFTNYVMKQSADAIQEHDTVGAVALDSEGNVAFATSTGGITCKRSGRAGGSAIVGAGGYADNRVGAVTCTGHGESLSKVVLSYQVIEKMEQGMDIQEAADYVLSDMVGRVGGYGGVISVGTGGHVAISMTTNQMTWAYIRNGRLYSGVKPGDMIEERNVPANIRISCDYIAEVKKTDSASLRQITTQNALKLFPRLARFIVK